MNAPDRWARFVVPEGHRKVEYEKDTKLPNAGCFKVQREDHTLGNLVRMQLHRDPAVIFSGYQLPHPLDYRCLIRVQTTKDSSPIQAVNTSLELLSGEYGQILTAFGNEVARRRPGGY